MATRLVSAALGSALLLWLRPHHDVTAGQGLRPAQVSHCRSAGQGGSCSGPRWEGAWAHRVSVHGSVEKRTFAYWICYQCPENLDERSVYKHVACAAV